MAPGSLPDRVPQQPFSQWAPRMHGGNAKPKATFGSNNGGHAMRILCDLPMPLAVSVAGMRSLAGIGIQARN